MEHLFNSLIDGLGVTPRTLLLCLVAASLACNLIGRMIPDDATGFLGLLRKVAKVVGLYVSNRIGSGVSVNDVTKSIAESAIPARLADVENRAILKPFPDAEVHVATRGPDGRFAKLESPWIVTVLIALLVLPLLGGCATAGASSQLRAGAQALCQSTPVLALAINEIRDDTNRSRALFGLRALEAACPLLFPAALSEANRLRAHNA